MIPFPAKVRTRSYDGPNFKIICIPCIRITKFKCIKILGTTNMIWEKNLGARRNCRSNRYTQKWCATDDNNNNNNVFFCIWNEEKLSNHAHLDFRRSAGGFSINIRIRLIIPNCFFLFLFKYIIFKKACVFYFAYHVNMLVAI